MEILFENKEYWICVKPPELVSEQTPNKDGFADLLAEQNGGYVGVIHRLDKGVGGVMIYAKTPAAAARLSKDAEDRKMKKEYVALLPDSPEQEQGELVDLLYFDRSRNKVFPVKRERKGVKEAKLLYHTISRQPIGEEGRVGALVSVTPLTGRTHQIRVQFASRGLPIVGDKKYGDRTDVKTKCICLCCYRLTVDGKEYSLAKFPWEEN